MISLTLFTVVPLLSAQDTDQRASKYINKYLLYFIIKSYVNVSNLIYLNLTDKKLTTYDNADAEIILLGLILTLISNDGTTNGATA